MHGLSPCAVHLVVLLSVLDWRGTASAASTLCLLLLLHHLHALHLLSSRRSVLLLHGGLLGSMLLRLHLLSLLGRHLLVLLLLLLVLLLSLIHI